MSGKVFIFTNKQNELKLINKKIVSKITEIKFEFIDWYRFKLVQSLTHQYNRLTPI